MYSKDIFSGDVSILGVFDIKDRLFVVGTGSPEGVVSAPIGSRFFNSEADQGQSWEKITGTGNIGWRRLALLRSGKLVSSANYTFVLADAAEYVRFTGIAGEATVVSDRFETDREIHGEIEGGSKTFVAGAGVTLRYPAGGTNVAPTNSRFFIKFKSPNDAQLTIVPSVGGSGAEAFTDLSDAPNSLIGEAFSQLQVSSDETSLAFFNPTIVNYRSTATLNSNNAGTTLNASTVPAVRVTGPGENCFIRGKEAVANLRFLIVNQKEVPLNLNHNNTDIDEENRFHFDNGKDLILPPGGWADILYVNDRWRIQTVSHPANTYDTFIPEINGSTSNPTASYTEQFGDYALIDRLCHFEMRLNWQSISGGTGNIRIPLPFARHSNTANGGPAIAVMTGLSTTPPIYACYSGFNNIGFRNAAGNEISLSDLESEGVIALSGTYIIGE